MDCSKARRLISEALDGELDGSAAESLHAHVAQCAECARFRSDSKRIAAAMAGMAAPEATGQDALRMARRVRAELSIAPAQTSWAFRAMAIAAMALLAVGVIFLSLELKAARSEIAQLSGAAPHDGTNGQTGVTVMGGIPIPRSAALESGVDQQVQAFHSVQSYLGGALRWMASDADQVEVGMSGSASATPASSQGLVLVVSFQYLERLRDGATTLLSAPQFVLVPGEEASVRLAARGGAAGEAFRYRVGADVKEGQIHATVNFNPEGVESRGPAEIASPVTASVSVKEGVPVLLGASGDPERRRELYMLAVTRSQGVAVQTGAGENL